MTDNEALEYFYGQMERGNIKNDTMQIAYECAIAALEDKSKYKKMWRYTDYEHGGIVFADTKEAALKKLKAKYNKDDFEVWEWLNDDYYDSDNPDVIDCY